MKITNDDFTSHVCDDADKDGDGLGWSLETDMTTEGKDELIRNQKLGEQIEKFLETYHNCNPYKGKEDPLFFQDIQKLLEDGKK